MTFIPDDWAGIFQLDTAFLELFVRSSALYFGILALMRLMPRRAGGELATMDLVFVVLIAQAAAQALGDYSSISGALVIIVTFRSEERRVGKERSAWWARSGREDYRYSVWRD